MNQYQYLKTQVDQINFDKWIEGERTNCDPGDAFIMKWIEGNAGDFREKWETSLCQNCIRCPECGWRLLKQCEFYIEQN